jgi:hypothetical protein
MVVKNGKPMAMVTATLLIQSAWSDTEDEQKMQDMVGVFERSIDTTDVLRRVAGATVRHNGSVVELQCDVEYGPIWANEADMRRHLERQLGAIAGHVGGREHWTREVKPVDFPTQEQLDELIRKLEAQSNDLAIPLTRRKQIATVASRLKRGADAGRVPRMA